VKLLVLAIDGMGMGHLSRTLTISQSLTAVEPQAKVHFLIESPAFHMVSAAGFDLTKIPDPRHPLGRHDLRGRRSEYETGVVKHIVKTFQPRAMLIDFVIDRSMFTFLRKQDCRIAVVLRKMRSRAMRQLANDPAARLVDAWLVPHERDEFNLSELPAEIARRCHFVGQVVRQFNPASIPVLRQRYARGKKFLAVIALGGGGSPEARRIAAAARQAVQELGASRDDLGGLVVWGPLNPEPLPKKSGNMQTIRFEPEMPELFAAADLVICNAGYNTMGEVEASGTPGIVIPLATTGRDDQQARAESFCRRGRMLVAGQSPAVIGQAVTRLLESRQPEKQAPKILGDPTRAGKALRQIVLS
jgi:UDP-N-acetylglucosamine--N-acetylmuramyl-(pentapeptide) pyrophosphoryl-undecaprenol N-acetylglucosamine transferase